AEIYSLSLHDALPILADFSQGMLHGEVSFWRRSQEASNPSRGLAEGGKPSPDLKSDSLFQNRRGGAQRLLAPFGGRGAGGGAERSEEHTSELQSLTNL